MTRSQQFRTPGPIGPVVRAERIWKVTIMARALLGHLPTAADPLLLAEIAKLRRRVADLEAQVAELRSHGADLDSVELHAELHAMTQEHQAEPV